MRLAALVGWLVVVAAQAEEPGGTAQFEQRAQAAYLASQARHRAAATNAEAMWQFGRACFDLAEFAPSDARRAALAEEGIAVCRALVAQESGLAAGHYYLALNLGQLARTKSLGALRLVTEIERTFQIARELDPRFDFAGPDRCLGLLYLDAPGWPTSVGSRTKARFHLNEAVRLAPEYPDNRLCRLEALARWRDWKAVHLDLPETLRLLEAGRRRFAGEAWTASWVDWDRRCAEIRAKAAVQPAPKPSRDTR